MLKTLNFDIIFIIIFIGMIAGAFFKKSRKLSFNFLYFVISLLTVGLITYFKADTFLIEKGANFFSKCFGILPSTILNSDTYGIIYMGFLMVFVLLIFLLIKFIAFLTQYEKRKYKEDISYTTAHRPIGAVLLTVLKYAAYLYLFIVAVILINPVLKFDLSNSYIITAFQKFDPVVKFLLNKGNEVFKVILKL